MRYNWDLEDIGENIKRTVQEAVDSKDFGSLNQTIRNTINSAFGGVTESGPPPIDIDLGTGASSRTKPFDGKYKGKYDQKYDGKKQGARFYEEKPHTEYKPSLYVNTAGKKAFATILMVAGYGLGAMMALAFVATALSTSIIGGSLLHVALGTLGLMFVPCAAMAAVGTRRLSRVKRFQLYLNTIKGEEYCNVKDLARRILKPDKYVVKDLHWMLKNMWFLQGHLDDQNTCLMTTDAAYREYVRLMRQREAQQKAETERAAAATQAERSRKQSMDPQVLSIIEKGDDFIQKIRACNDAIRGEEVSAKIFRMETLTRRIFARVEEEPDTVGDIRRLMEYYLPTAVKLLEAYKDLDAQPVQGENIITSKREIEETLDTLNQAFEVLLDDMFQDTAWDVSTDVSVLKAMLAQEGLTGKDFKTGGKG